MRALLDTGIWFRRYHGIPMSRSLRDFLNEEVEEFHICPLSVSEICFKWQRGRLPGIPHPQTWVAHSLQNFVIDMPDSAAAMTAGLWDWDHGDLVDRTLAAIAKERGLTLIHTDKVLKNFTGFPQKWSLLSGYKSNNSIWLHSVASLFLNSCFISDSCKDIFSNG